MIGKVPGEVDTVGPTATNGATTGLGLHSNIGVMSPGEVLALAWKPGKGDSYVPKGVGVIISPFGI